MRLARSSISTATRAVPADFRYAGYSCIHCGTAYYGTSVLKKIKKRFFAIQEHREMPDNYPRDLGAGGNNSATKIQKCLRETYGDSVGKSTTSGRLPALKLE